MQLLLLFRMRGLMGKEDVKVRIAKYACENRHSSPSSSGWPRYFEGRLLNHQVFSRFPFP